MNMQEVHERREPFPHVSILSCALGPSISFFFLFPFFLVGNAGGGFGLDVDFTPELRNEKV